MANPNEANRRVLSSPPPGVERSLRERRRLADVPFIVFPELCFGLSGCYGGVAGEADGVIGAVIVASVRVVDDEFDFHICLFSGERTYRSASSGGMMVNMARFAREKCESDGSFPAFWVA